MPYFMCSIDLKLGLIQKSSVKNLEYSFFMKKNIILAQNGSNFWSKKGQIWIKSHISNQNVGVGGTGSPSQKWVATSLFQNLALLITKLKKVINFDENWSVAPILRLSGVRKYNFFEILTNFTSSVHICLQNVHIIPSILLIWVHYHWGFSNEEFWESFTHFEAKK